MIEIIKLEKPTRQGVTKQAKFTNGENPVTIENPTVVNAVEKLFKENEELTNLLKRADGWDEIVNELKDDVPEYQEFRKELKKQLKP